MTEKDHGWHDVVRQGIEWVRRDLQVDEIGRPRLDEARTEK
jgi:hypothetical protein